MPSKIPSDWHPVRLEEIAMQTANAIVDGPFGSNLKTTDYVNIPGVPVLQGKNVTGNSFRWHDVRYISDEKAEELKRSTVREGDILTVKIGSVGYSAIVDNLRGFPFAIIPANLLKISIDEQKADSQYVHQFLISAQGAGRLRVIAGSTAQPALSLKAIRQYLIPLPPLPEQRKIAEILSSVDEAIQATQAVIEQTRRVKEGLLQELLTKGIGHTRFKKSVIGEIPESWELKRLGAILEVQGGYAFSSRDAEEVGVRWLKIANVAPGQIDWSSASYLPPSFITRHPDFLLSEGDVVMAMTRPILSGQLKIARIGLQDKDSLLNQRVCRLRPLPTSTASFIFQLMESERVVQSIQKMIGGTDPPNISGSQIESISVGVPSLTEQIQMSAIITSANESKRLACSQYETLVGIKTGLLQDLLTGKVRVSV